MREQPEQPRHPATEAQRAEGRSQVDHGGIAADGGEVAVVTVAERFRFLARHAAQDVVRCCTAHLLGRWRNAGHRGRFLAGRMARRRRQIADHADLGMAGQAQVRQHLDAAGTVDVAGRGVGRCRQQPAQRRCCHARRPDHTMTFNAIAAVGCRTRFDLQAVRVDHGDFGVEPHLDPQFFKLLFCLAAQAVRHGLQHARATFDQQHRGTGRVDAAEFALQRVACNFGQRACHFDPGRAGTDHAEGHQCALSRRVGLVLGGFERHQHTTPDLEGIGQRLQAGR